VEADRLVEERSLDRTWVVAWDTCCTGRFEEGRLCSKLVVRDRQGRRGLADDGKVATESISLSLR
jgi:hypothetical protein